MEQVEEGLSLSRTRSLSHARALSFSLFLSLMSPPSTHVHRLIQPCPLNPTQGQEALEEVEVAQQEAWAREAMVIQRKEIAIERVSGVHQTPNTKHQTPTPNPQTPNPTP